MSENKSLQIIFPEENEEYPECIHGPTILFAINSQKYFSCSFFRNRQNKCFHLDFGEWKKYREKEHPKVNHRKELQGRLEYETVEKLELKQRIFCLNCKFFISDVKNHKQHNIKIGISDEMMKSPSHFLKQLDCDDMNAQYFFDNHTLKFFEHVLNRLRIEKVVCIGAPRFNDFVKSIGKESFLLDIDDRYRSFNPTMNFAKYNMCNNYFFEDESHKLERFLKDTKESTNCEVCLFLDPPFGCRTELIATSIQQISQLYRKFNRHLKIMTIFWIFPYYQERYINNVMPQMEMMDFEISYDNHKVFSREYKGRKEGSPIRSFTNVDLNLISYPSHYNEYVLCKPCLKFVSVKNKHCLICRICPSKNGATYKHCKKCRVCVKPNYIHCDKCLRCVQQANHDCLSLLPERKRC
jgi:hypothetical protein